VVSIATPIDLANYYKASLHASYYVEHHPDPVAVLVAGRHTQYDGTLPIWTSFESQSFLERFGRFVDQLPGAALPVEDTNLPVGRIAASVRDAVDVVTDTITLSDLNGAGKRFTAEGFFNQYSVFIFAAPSGARSSAGASASSQSPSAASELRTPRATKKTTALDGSRTRSPTPRRRSRRRTRT
jgi:hypothetical protein